MPGIVGGFGKPGPSTFVPAGGGKPVRPGPSVVKLPGAARPATPGPSSMPAPPGGHPATPGPSHVTPVGGGHPATPGPSTMPAPSGGSPISTAQFSGSGGPANTGHVGLPGTLGGGGGSTNPIIRKAPPKPPAAPAPPPSLNPSQFPSTPGVMSNQQVQQTWDTAVNSMKGQLTPNQYKADLAAAPNMANISQVESGNKPSIQQYGMPTGGPVTGYGLFQDTPTSGASGGWMKGNTNPSSNTYGNLFNAENNARAAVNIYNQQGYHAWTEPTGQSLPAGPPPR
jgi:hypothetical protein